jgi:hypothetical protein
MRLYRGVREKARKAKVITVNSTVKSPSVC